MAALLLVSVFALGQVQEDTLLSGLDADFERLVKGDPHRAQLREAARLLAETNDSDRWTNYSQATSILRRARSKAAIPLLLAYMVRHVERSSSHIYIPAYAETLSVLAGKDIPNPYQYVAERRTPVRQAVEKLVREWWQPQQDRISTDLDGWSAEQIQVLAARLVKRAAWQMSGSSTDPEEWRGRPTSYALYHLLYYHLLERGSSDKPEWTLAELHPQMLPTFMASAGYRHEPQEPLSRDTSRPAYAAVELLAALRRNGELEELERIAGDANQSAGARLTCVLALYQAEQKLLVPVLLSIAESDKNLERRLVAILALRYAGDDRPAGRALVGLLDDRNPEIRTAAICALRGPLPPQAVPKLKQAIDALDPPQAMLFVFDVLGQYKSREACEALAGFLAAGLEDKRKTEHLSRALSALERASGQRWGEAGPQSNAFYREKCRQAIDWWQSHGRLTLE